jgi:hypothetical protein
MGNTARNWIGLMALAGAFGLAGCASVFGDGDQTILMTVMPEGAQCLGWRHDHMVGVYNPFFQSMIVSKSKDELLITCTAYGYKTARLRLMPSQPNWDAPEDKAFDYVTGTLTHYDGNIVIAMEKADPPAGPSTPPN